MAQLGIRTYDELIGRTDLLDKSKAITHWKAKGLDFSKIFHQPDMPADEPRYQVEVQDHGLEKALDHKLIAQARAALDKGEKVSFISPIKNVNRTVGTMLSGEVAKKYVHEGLPDGITLDLGGEGIDYVGKGLSGGRIIVRPNTEFRGRAVEYIIAGNTVLYGAITGEAFFNGVAGKHFAMHNSGAVTVVENTDNHESENKTGRTEEEQRETGRNFAAGMSGGIAY